MGRLLQLTSAFLLLLRCPKVSTRMPGAPTCAARSCAPSNYRAREGGELPARRRIDSKFRQVGSAVLAHGHQ